ncbi:MAG: NAD(P)H-dependent oxidoreductase [Aureliella sp.]
MAAVVAPSASRAELASQSEAKALILPGKRKSWLKRSLGTRTMSELNQEEVIERLQWRYAVKKFDPEKKIEAATWDALEQALLLTPSSYGLQPWKFAVITDQAIMEKLPEASWNQMQPKDCSHMVVLAARKTMDADYIQEYMQSVVTKRELPARALDGYQKMLTGIVDGMDSHFDWNARQVYIALGQLMVAAAMVGVDTCPMEGIVPDQYDEIAGFKGTDYATVVGCACGYRHADDAQSKAAKVRYPAERLISRL